jgi:hypothetical protein
MKFSITIILAIVANTCFHPIYSQDKVTFGYDAAGNRISRVIDLNSLRSAQDTVPETEEMYSELLSDIEIKIYPNPTDGLLKVEIYNMPDQQTAEIRLYNLSGNLITNLTAKDGTAEIDLSRQPTGIYLMRITAGEYQTEWRIIKK